MATNYHLGESPTLYARDLAPGQVVYGVFRCREGVQLIPYTVVRVLATRLVLARKRDGHETAIRVDKTSGRVLNSRVGDGDLGDRYWRLITEDDPLLEDLQEAALVTDAQLKAREAVKRVDWDDPSSVDYALKTLNAYRLLMKD